MRQFVLVQLTVGLAVAGAYAAARDADGENGTVAAAVRRSAASSPSILPPPANRS